MEIGKMNATVTVSINTGCASWIIRALVWPIKIGAAIHRAIAQLTKTTLVNVNIKISCKND